MDHIEFECPGCHARYRVSASLAGRVAECRHCKAKMTVPNPAEAGAPEQADKQEDEIGFADAPPPLKPAARPASRPPHRAAPPPPPEPEADEPPDLSAFGEEEQEQSSEELPVGDEPVDSSGPDLSSFAVKDDAPQYVEPKRHRQRPLVPELWADTLLPILLLVASVGWAGSVAVKHALASSNPILGFVFIALALVGLAVVVLPIMMKGIESASKSIEFRLSDAIILQTLGLASVPTAACVLGYFNAGTQGAVGWGLIGLLTMVVLIVLIYRADVGKAVLATVFAGLSYAVGGAVAFGVLCGVAFIMAKSGLTLPWRDKPIEIAKVEASKTVEKPVEASKTVDKPPEVVEAPKTVEVVEAPKPKFAWNGPAVDPAPTIPGGKFTADGTPMRIEFKLPMIEAKSSPGSPFLAVLDSVALHVYDLRTGKRTGFMKEGVPALDGSNALLSPDGTTLLVGFGYGHGNGIAPARTERARAMISPNGAGQVSHAVGAAVPGAAAFAPVPTSPELTVWSIPERAIKQHISLQGMQPLPQVLGFTRSNQVVLLVANTQTRKLTAQVWDLRTATSVKEVEVAEATVPQSAVALSRGGRYVAVIDKGHLGVFDTDEAKQVGDVELPQGEKLMATSVRALTFSRDGSQLAILSADGSSMKLQMLDMTNGQLASDAMLAGGARGNVTADDLMWVPQGGAMLIDTDWIDCATGRLVASVPPQSAGQQTGRPRLMISDYHALIEFAPPQAAMSTANQLQRVIYKSVMLPKKDIDTALASSRKSKGPDEGPSTGSAVAVETPGGNPTIPGGESTTTSPPVGPPKQLLKDALAHLAAGRNQDALAYAQAVLNQFPKGATKPASDEQAAALHVEGVAYMKLGDPDKARGPMDLAVLYAKTSRSLIVNRAKLDIASQNPAFVLRAARELDRLASSSPTVDDEVLNLFGLAVNKAKQDATTAGGAKIVSDHLDALIKKLEATKPGMKRWGSKWVAQSDYDAAANPPDYQAEKVEADKRAKQAQADFETARKALVEAKKQAPFDDRKPNIQRDPTRKNQPMYVSKAEDAFQAAQKELDAAKLNIETVKAKAPAPPYEENLDPVAPELDLTPRSSG